MKRVVLPFCIVLVSSLFCPAADDVKVKRLFNGKNLDGWKAVNPQAANFWKVGEAKMSETEPRMLEAGPLEGNDAEQGNAAGALINTVGADWKPQGIDLYSETTFGDCVIELEFMVAKNSNSGIYVMGEYEVQVLDSWGKETLGNGDVGALYGAAPPKVNASLEPGVWQKFVIDFTAPRFDGEGKKIANAKFNRITLNGTVVQEDVEMKSFTHGGIKSKEAPVGPLMFQGNHGPVAFRNILVTDK
ncbi:MAG TPA: DUF1080 domain-containing protein [Planctomycetaceae bacterium]|nr:DUF1080 domain-containing protein [Planctomycetaceae bacterium]